MKRIFLFLSIWVCISAHAEFFFTQKMVNSHLKNYSEEELALIQKDLQVVRQVCLEGKENTSTRFYLATAGAPGSRKTTILERFVSSHSEYQGGVYLDPDPRGLKFMVHTYAQSLTPLQIATVDDYDTVIKNAYEKWRGASNYITVYLLEEAFTLGRSIIHGTTSTGDHIFDFFPTLKNNQYEIVLILCACPNSVRYEAVDYRNKVVRFYQSSPEDAVAKGILFTQRMPWYFASADKLYLYWSEALHEQEKLAAIWTPESLEICDEKALQEFALRYEEDRAKLAEKEIVVPSLDTLLHSAKNP